MLALLRQRNFALLWLGGLISLTGNWVLRAALPYYVYTQSGSTLATATMVAASLVPRMLFSSFAGVFVDRGDRQKIMVVTNLMAGIILLPLLWVSSAQTLWIVYLVSFLQSSLGVFFDPAENALLPTLVDDTHLLQANSLNALNNNLARLIGPPVGGVILAVVGLSGVVVFDSITFLIACAMIGLIRVANRPPIPESVKRAPAIRLRPAVSNFWNEWKEGVAIIRRDRFVSWLFISFVLLNLGGVMMDPLGPAFIADVVKASAQIYGTLLTIQAAGGIAGGLIAGRLGHRRSPVSVYAWAEIIVGVILLIRFNLPSLPVVVATNLLVGLPAAIGAAAVQTLFQKSVPNSHLGRVSGVMMTTISILSLVGVLGVAGALGEVLGIVRVLNIAGGITVLGGLVALIFLPARRP